MEPFRAFVADKLPAKQRTFGFSMQSFFIGIGATVASALPWIFTNWFHVSSTAAKGTIADNVKWSFYIGAIAFLLAVLYTVFTTKEYPPTEEDLQHLKENKRSFKNGFNEIGDAIKNMPKKMKQLALIQFVTWPGLFLMWFYYTPTVAAEIFKGKTGDALYAEGQNYAGLSYSVENIVTLLFALCLPFIAGKIGKKYTHFMSLLIGGIGLIGINFVGGADDKFMLLVIMAMVGIAWSSILSMPYAMLSDCLPSNKIGVYMGLFNFFIVIPEIIASLFFGKIMHTYLGDSRIMAVTIGGCLLILAGILTLRLKEETVK
jgi:maltose/moltooligosaccharide transporter